MHYILIVIAVFNGRYYHEDPQYAVEYPTKAACEAVAVAFPTKGVEFNKAVCVPQFPTPIEYNK